jgi:hypothetical protein
MNKDFSSILTRCNLLANYWEPRNSKMQQWYRLIEMVDELKTAKMESFVGNDPRAMYNLVLHMLTVPIPYKVESPTLDEFEAADVNSALNNLMSLAWNDIKTSFRKSGPQQSWDRNMRGLLLSTGWYAICSYLYDDGSRAVADIWNTAETFPIWDDEYGLSEVLHRYTCSGIAATKKAGILSPEVKLAFKSDQIVNDYWWIEPGVIFNEVWNAVLIGNQLVKCELTRFKKIPVYIAPVGGLPDTGALSSGSNSSTSDTMGERWKEEIGQAIVATNENIYRTWNKWWSFSLQLLRDTAQPRIFERSRSGKAIVKPEDVFKRGAIWRGGSEDDVEFVSPPIIPVELRATQIDLEAMMQRGGPSWSMYGASYNNVSAYVMSQIAASANQLMRPYHEALQDLFADIADDWIADIRERHLSPYNWKLPSAFDSDCKVKAEFEVEIPGEMIQKATIARMLDPDFRLSYSYTVNKLFPDITNPMQERARIRADQAELNPMNGLIAYIRYCRDQAAYLMTPQGGNDYATAKLYEMAAQASEAQLSGTSQQQSQQSATNQQGARTEGGSSIVDNITNMRAGSNV